MTLIVIALVCLPILPTDPEDLLGRLIVVLLQDLKMAAVDGPTVSSIEWRGQNYCLIDKTLLFVWMSRFSKALFRSLSKAAVAGWLELDFALFSYVYVKSQKTVCSGKGI